MYLPPMLMVLRAVAADLLYHKRTVAIGFADGGFTCQQTSLPLLVLPTYKGSFSVEPSFTGCHIFALVLRGTVHPNHSAEGVSGDPHLDGSSLQLLELFQYRSVAVTTALAMSALGDACCPSAAYQYSSLVSHF